MEKSIHSSPTPPQLGVFIREYYSGGDSNMNKQTIRKGQNNKIDFSKCRIPYTSKIQASKHRRVRCTFT